MRRVGAGTVLLLVVVQGAAAQVRLPRLEVRGQSPCEVHPETALETADLWLAARAALESASAPAAGAPRFLVEQWRRTLDRGFRLRWERRDTTRLTGLHPFEKAPPGDLDREGYIQRRGWTVYYYGPDAGLLLSEGFLRRHCFTRVIGSGAAAGLVGLAFAPLPDTRATDVRGVLWVDPLLGELRRVEYSWTNPPSEASAPGVGGQADFVRLSSGGWIVRRWNIRMPRPIGELDGGFDGYTDQGGEILAVLAGARKPR